MRTDVAGIGTLFENGVRGVKTLQEAYAAQRTVAADASRPEYDQFWTRGYRGAYSEYEGPRNSLYFEYGKNMFNAAADSYFAVQARYSGEGGVNSFISDVRELVATLQSRYKIGKDEAEFSALRMLREMTHEDCLKLIQNSSRLEDISATMRAVVEARPAKPVPAARRPAPRPEVKPEPTPAAPKPAQARPEVRKPLEQRRNEARQEVSGAQSAFDQERTYMGDPKPGGSSEEHILFIADQMDQRIRFLMSQDPQKYPTMDAVIADLNVNQQAALKYAQAKKRLEAAQKNLADLETRAAGKARAKPEFTPDETRKRAVAYQRAKDKLDSATPEERGTARNDFEYAERRLMRALPGVEPGELSAKAKKIVGQKVKKPIVPKGVKLEPGLEAKPTKPVALRAADTEVDLQAPVPEKPTVESLTKELQDNRAQRIALNKELRALWMKRELSANGVAQSQQLDAQIKQLDNRAKALDSQILKLRSERAQAAEPGLEARPTEPEPLKPAKTVVEPRPAEPGLKTGPEAKGTYKGKAPVQKRDVAARKAKFKDAFEKLTEEVKKIEKLKKEIIYVDQNGKTYVDPDKLDHYMKRAHTIRRYLEKYTPKELEAMFGATGGIFNSLGLPEPLYKALLNYEKTLRALSAATGKSPDEIFGLKPEPRVRKPMDAKDAMEITLANKRKGDTDLDVYVESDHEVYKKDKDRKANQKYKRKDLTIIARVLFHMREGDIPKLPPEYAEAYKKLPKKPERPDFDYFIDVIDIAKDILDKRAAQKAK
jgi:hypothetical protein